MICVLVNHSVPMEMHWEKAGRNKLVAKIQARCQLAPSTSGWPDANCLPSFLALFMMK